MNRRNFIEAMAALPLGAAAMKLSDLSKLAGGSESSDRMPLLFVGHGSPMNEITDNPYRDSWKKIGESLSKPKAVLCISAHWLTNGTSVAVTSKPATIHDFGGFPDELFKVQYPAPGAPDLAKQTAELAKSAMVHEDHEWGLDHGAWSVLMHMYPGADVPIYQLSIDYGKPAAYHYKLASELAALRKRGVLIVASGNVVHNLGMISWNDPSVKFDWAVAFDEHVKKAIENGNDDLLVNYQKAGSIAKMAHPTNDHYLPLLYTIGLKDKKDTPSFFNDTIDMGSISMRSVIFS